MWAAALLSDNGFECKEELEGAEIGDLVGLGPPTPKACSRLVADIISFTTRVVVAERRRLSNSAARSSRSRSPPVAAMHRVRIPAATGAAERASAVCRAPPCSAGLQGNGPDFTMHLRAPPERRVLLGGPLCELARVSAVCPTAADAARWRDEARIRAMVQPCARSLPSIRAGLRCWEAFCVRVLKHPRIQIPPSAADLVSWGALFRCAGTYSNYVSYVKVGCLLAGASVSVFKSPEVLRGKAAVGARHDFVPRPRLFIRHMIVTRMAVFSMSRPAWRQCAMLFMFAYAFLLRVPSEALPAVYIDHEDDAPTHPSALLVGPSSVTLILLRRKNRPQGSRLMRECWCAQCPRTCPVHVLGKWASQRPAGSHLFPGLTAAAALRSLRCLLGIIHVADAGLFRLHDLRRGHAKDLQHAGATLGEILAAGQWRGPAFLRYLDVEELERDAVIEARPAAVP